MSSVGENKSSESCSFITFNCDLSCLRLRLVAEELAEFIRLDDIISKREAGFYQFVRKEIQEIEMLKVLKEVLHELNLSTEGDGGTQDQENEVEKRVQGNLDLVEKVCDSFPEPLCVAQLWGQLKKELDNLHLERLLDLGRSKVLKALGIGSWQRLKEKATESGMALHDYIFASLKENPKNDADLPMGAVELLCAKSFINLGNIRDLEEAYISVFGQGVGQQST